MILFTLLFALLAPLYVLAGTPGALRALSGKDYSHHLKRTDEPFPARLSYAKRGPGSVPSTLKVPAAEPVLVRRSPLSGVLVARQGPGCDAGLSLCPDGNACCPTGAECCTQSSLCCTTGACCGNSCCENGGICCGNGCCDAGSTCQTINGAPACCKAGQQCDAFVGCQDPGLVECAGETFCCPPGETCGRDSAGNATCNGHSASETQGIAADPTPGNTSILGPSDTTSTSSATTGFTRATSTTSAATSTGSHTTTTGPNTTSSGSSGGALGLVPSRDTFGVIGTIAFALAAFV